jgi:ferritin-like metal-binding protein YciE
MSSIVTLRDLLVEEIKDLYSAEKQLVKALPKVAEAATDEQLRQTILEHLEETKQHVSRLEKVFAELDESPKAKTCEAMKGLISEGEKAIGQKGPDALRDAGLIGAAQRVEHYEIAAYGTARAFAEELDLPAVVELLQATLDEEGEADKTLSRLAGAVNRAACLAGVPD